MYYIVYQTTNLINGMIYIGSHQTDDLCDGYLGSGKLLKKALKKYGKENFKFECLHLCSSKDEMFSLEKELVNESFVNDPNTYNLKVGGSGGNPGLVGAFKGHNHSDFSKKKIGEASANRRHSEATRKKMSKNNFSKTDPENHKNSCSLGGSKSKPKSIEHRKKISETLKKINCSKPHYNIGKIREKIKCVYCDKCGSKNNMIRFHFENCRNKPNDIIDLN